jgi:hypothetical protein
MNRIGTRIRPLKSRIRLAIKLLGIAAGAWAIFAIWSLHQGMSRLSRYATPAPTLVEQSSPNSEPQDAAGLATQTAHSGLPDPEQLNGVAIEQSASCDLGSTGNPYIWRHRPVSTPEGARVGGYDHDSDAELAERALAGDGFAQSRYAEQWDYENRIAVIDPDDSRPGPGSERESWEQGFNTMRNFYIMSFKSGFDTAPMHLAGFYMWDLFPKRDLVEASAWLYLSEMVHRTSHDHVERYSAVIFTAEQKEAGRELAREFVELYDIGFLKGFDLPPVSDYRRSGTGLPATGFSANDVQQAGCPSASVESSTDAAHRDWFSIALTELADYERAAARPPDIFNAAVTEDLNRRFAALRRHLVMALQQGSVSALPILVQIHSGIENRKDPVEAAAWSEIGRLIYDFSPSDEASSQESDDFAYQVQLRARQYIAIHGLE